MLLVIISAIITSVLFLVLVYISVGERSLVSDRLRAVAADVQKPASGSLLGDEPTGLAAIASVFTNIIRPIRNLVTSDDEELAYQLSLAGFKEPAQVEVFAAAKIMLPVVGLIASSFAGTSMLIVAIVATVACFFVPDLFITQLIARRKERVRLAFPDALDLLVICMEAGLGIDQALVRVGREIELSCPVLAEELQVIMHEQRAGKPRLEAWRSMSERLDLDVVRQFVTMLVQTERFGTPIADALGQFADSLRVRRTQEAEEQAAKSGVKLLFPLVFFIFPSIFVVLLVPAILHIGKSFAAFAK
jgi:tight adherence protein C